MTVQGRNQWRAENPKLRPDLPGAELSQADLSGADLQHANLLKADLSRSNLRNADFSEENSALQI
jgi:uncharacterized protein YjbI with pentapeptide repeats